MQGQCVRVKGDYLYLGKEGTAISINLKGEQAEWWEMEETSTPRDIGSRGQT